MPMNQKPAIDPRLPPLYLPAKVESPLVDVIEASATKGEWATPAVKKVSLGLALSNFSATWRGPRGLKSENVSAGALSICELDHSRRFEMRSTADFAIVVVEDEALQQAAQAVRVTKPELQARDVLQDPTLRRL